MAKALILITDGMLLIMFKDKEYFYQVQVYKCVFAFDKKGEEEKSYL